MTNKYTWDAQGHLTKEIDNATANGSGTDATANRTTTHAYSAAIGYIDIATTLPGGSATED